MISDVRDRNAGDGDGYLAMGLVMKRWQGPSYTSEKYDLKNGY